MPSLALLSALFSSPPITKVGSSPPSASTAATRLVVVVLPCVPATAMPCRKRISSPSISARRTTGMRARDRRCELGVLRRHGRRDHHHARARDLSRLVADEDPRTQLREARGHSVRAQVRALHGVAEVESTSAMPPMPAPPMPIRWIRFTRRMRSLMRARLPPAGRGPRLDAPRRSRRARVPQPPWRRAASARCRTALRAGSRARAP